MLACTSVAPSAGTHTVSSSGGGGGAQDGAREQSAPPKFALVVVQTLAKHKCSRNVRQEGKMDGCFTALF